MYTVEKGCLTYLDYTLGWVGEVQGMGRSRVGSHIIWVGGWSEVKEHGQGYSTWKIEEVD